MKNIIKRAAVAALTAVVLFAGMPAKSVMAADSKPVYTTVQVSGKADAQKVTYKLRLYRSKVTDGRVAVLYDPAVFEVAGVTEAVKFNVSDVNKNFEDGLLQGVSYAFVSDYEKNVPGQLLTLNISVKSGTLATDSVIKTVVYGINNDDTEVVPYTVLEDTVTVGKEKLVDPKLTALDQTLIGVNVKWAQDKNADGYVVYRATSASGPYTKIATVKSGNYWDVTVKNNKTYYYKVAAYRGKGSSTEYSKESNVLSIKVKKFLGLFS